MHSNYAYVGHDDLLDDIKLCQQIVEQHGMEMLILNQTRPDIGLRVVKVIVPGMRHFWKRLGAGRLYEVPVQFGWLKNPLQRRGSIHSRCGYKDFQEINYPNKRTTKNA